MAILSVRSLSRAVTGARTFALCRAPAARALRSLARPLSTIGGPPLKRDDEEAQVKKANASALKAGAAGSFGLTSLLGGLPIGSVVAAEAAAPAAWLGANGVMFLQVFPPLAAQACFLAPWGAVKKIQEAGDVGGMPLLPWAAMAVNGVGWVTYGVLAGSPTIWAPNITAFLFGSYYWYVYANNCKDSPIPWLGGGAVAIGAIGYLGMMANSGADLMGQDPAFILGLYLNVVVVAMFGGPLGAIAEVNKTGKTDLIPFAFSIATFANCSTWAMFGIFVIHDPIVWFPNILGFGSACAQLFMHAKFGIDQPGSAVVEEVVVEEAAIEEEKSEEAKSEEKKAK